MFRRLENIIYLVEPNLVDFSEVPFVQEGIGNSLHLLPFPLASNEFFSYFLEVRVLLELLVLSAVPSLSESK